MSTTSPESEALAAVRDLTLIETAENVCRRSGRWLSDQMKAAEKAGDPIDHNRFGNKITFSPAQVDSLRERYRYKAPAPKPVTTGPSKA